jgi:hypothetical protein
MAVLWSEVATSAGIICRESRSVCDGKTFVYTAQHATFGVGAVLS